MLYLGGMERNRGAELMLDAFAQVVARMPAARLRLVGHFAPPGLEGEMRAEAARRGIGHAVEFVGRVPFDQVGAHLAAARVGWVTGGAAAKNQKNIPTKLFEYMAYGLPVVSSDLPSTRPFVPPDVGLLAGADDAAGHAAALLRLLGDGVTAEALGAAGRRRVGEAWNWAATVSYTHLRAHETVLDLVCRLLLEKQTINKLAKDHNYIIIISLTFRHDTSSNLDNYVTCI